jgi:hypothetical protein
VYLHYNFEGKIGLSSHNMIFLGKTRKNAGIEKEERGTNWPETTGKGKGKTGNV